MKNKHITPEQQLRIELRKIGIFKKKLIMQERYEEAARLRDRELRLMRRLSPAEQTPPIQEENPS